MVPFSVLDLSPIAQGGTVADALHRSRALAQQAERLGYRRYWLAEHHNLPVIASAATAVVIGHVAANTDAEAARLFTSLQQSFVQLRRGTPGPLPPPVDRMDGLWTPAEQAGVGHAFREAVVGSRATVQRGLAAFLRRTRVDELMVTAAIFDPAARLRSFELVAQVRDAGLKSA